MTFRERLGSFLRRRHVRRAFAVALVAVVVYLVAMFPLGCGKLLADRLMLFPSTTVEDAGAASERLVDTPIGRMQVWVSSEGEARAEQFVLRLEGNGGRAEYAADYIADRWEGRPTQVWAMNHPGFGRSQGPATLDRLAPAAMGVFDAMVEAAGDRPVFIDADSMGAAIGLYVAAERPERVRGLVLKNPPPLRELILGRFGWWNLWLAAWPISRAVPEELDAVANARRCPMPAVVVTARLDTLVPSAYQQRIIDAYAGPVEQIWFEAGEHNTPLDEVTRRSIAEELERLAQNP